MSTAFYLIVLVVWSGGRGLGNLFMAVANHVVLSQRRGGHMIRHTTNLLYSKV